MNFYNKIGSILSQRSKVLKLSPSHEKMFVAYFRTRSGKQVSPGIQGISPSHDSSTPYIGFFQSLSDNKKVTKTINKNLSWNELKEELNKMPHEKKEIYLEALVRGLLSNNQNSFEDKTGKNKFYAFSKTLVLFSSAAILYFFYTKKFNLGNKSKGIGSIIFSEAREVETDKIDVTFNDVKGMDEARDELMEIVDYLREPERYLRLGGKLPKGVMLVGPPGTGKSLLARAIAGEANVPFFHMSGSEFDELLVGQGARRVRDLFEKAKERAPCIVFIDEIDSIGSKRSSSSLHPYANQTINQLLTAMDGFSKNEGVIVIGATNRVEDLDSALLRPGRFDIRVNCPKPDLAGRKEMFDLYLGKVKHRNINIDALARTTIGFTGADIQNMVNQAALKAAKGGYHFVIQKHLDEAKDRVIMGPVRIKGKFPDEKTTNYTAYHEAGHALVAVYTPHAIPLHKVTIIPRGDSLGHTSYMPKDDKYQSTKAEILALLDVAMGGRAAEELIFGKEFVTTGASSDLNQATLYAENFVKKFGMSEKVGLRNYELDENKQTLIKTNSLSPQTSEKIDIEIDRIMNESYERAKTILTTKALEHKLLAEALLEYETLTAEEVELVVKGKPLHRQPTEKTSEIKTGKKKQTRNLHSTPVITEGSGSSVQVNVD